MLIGTAIDELIRHHPSLKASVFDALKVTIGKIEELGVNFEVPKDLRQWYFLTPVSPPILSLDHDVAMDDVETATPPSNPHVQPTDGDQEPKNHDNYIVSFIDVFGRVSVALVHLSLLTNTMASFWKGCSSTHPIARTS